MVTHLSSCLENPRTEEPSGLHSWGRSVGRDWARARVCACCCDGHFHTSECVSRYQVWAKVLTAVISQWFYFLICIFLVFFKWCSVHMNLDGITDSVDLSLSKFWETVKDREASHAGVHGVTKIRIRLSDWTAVHVPDVPQHKSYYCRHVLGIRNYLLQPAFLPNILGGTCLYFFDRWFPHENEEDDTNVDMLQPGFCPRGGGRGFSLWLPSASHPTLLILCYPCFPEEGRDPSPPVSQCAGSLPGVWDGP